MGRFAFLAMALAMGFGPMAEAEAPRQDPEPPEPPEPDPDARTVFGAVVVDSAPPIARAVVTRAQSFVAKIVSPRGPNTSDLPTSEFGPWQEDHGEYVLRRASGEIAWRWDSSLNKAVPPGGASARDVEEGRRLGAAMTKRLRRAQRNREAMQRGAFGTGSGQP